MIDFLMPFEIYPVTIVGVLLLLAAALRARDRRAAVAWSVGGMLGGVLLSGLAANLTGIADSVDPLPWWRYAPTIALGAGSLVAQVVLIVFGILLVKDLFAAEHATEPPAVPTA
ncbi:MAG: hypothetical protein FDZ70_07440 [Actinobacteria bacterium]|nr:MAG: hypothetical protein FDZ70_07440 [Actinomycetota bacterium]